MRIIITLMFLIFSAESMAGGFYPQRDTKNVNRITNQQYFTQTQQSRANASADVRANASPSINISEDYDEAAASAYATVGSLIECPDTSGGIGTQTRSFGFSVSIAAKDRDCAKIRMMQNIGNMYPDSRRHQVLLDHMVCTLELWRELEKVGFSCKQFLALSPDPATHKQ